MRIIGEIPHELLKITVFRMNDKTSIKFEHDLVEHIIKFRDGSGIETLEDAEKLIDEKLISDVINHIGITSSNRGRRLQEIFEESEETNFPEIV